MHHVCMCARVAGVYVWLLQVGAQDEAGTPRDSKLAAMSSAVLSYPVDTSKPVRLISPDCTGTT